MNVALKVSFSQTRTVTQGTFANSCAQLQILISGFMQMELGIYFRRKSNPNDCDSVSWKRTTEVDTELGKVCCYAPSLYFRILKFLRKCDISNLYLDLSLSPFFFSIVLIGRIKVRQGETEIFHLFLHSPNTCNDQTAPDPSQEPKTPSVSPRWMAGAQILGPSSTAFSAAQQGLVPIQDAVSQIVS